MIEYLLILSLFHSREIVVDEAIMVNRIQMGTNSIHVDGKVRRLSVSHLRMNLTASRQPAKTIFTLISYDENTNSSVVLCKQSLYF
jgi:hypothetical protein